MKSDITLPQLLGGAVFFAALVFVGYWIAGLVGALIVVVVFWLPFLVWKWVVGAGSRAILSHIEGTLQRIELAKEHNDQCTDREWLIITGLRLAVDKTGNYENVSFTPERLVPFVARAAERYGYREGNIIPNEIHEALGRFFPDPNTGGPPRKRVWTFNRAIIEPSKYDPGLVGRYAAGPTATPTLPG